VRLLRHPQSGVLPALETEVEVTRRASALALSYAVHGEVRRVRLPATLAPARADALWRHTCFEAFVRASQPSGYWEFNLSPSLEWAAYRFNAYREGMAAELAFADLHIETQCDDSEFRLSAILDLYSITALRASEDWRLALSAVIEDQNGDKSYWALAHPQGKPDFHHPDSFALYLPP
jgi:hypothetical protein